MRSKDFLSRERGTVQRNDCSLWHNRSLECIWLAHPALATAATVLYIVSTAGCANEMHLRESFKGELQCAELLLFAPFVVVFFLAQLLPQKGVF